MGKLGAAIVREIREAIPSFLFFLAVFLLGRITKALVLEEYHLTITGTAVAAVGALIVAKAILVADALPVTRIFSRHPLVYSIAWKATIYFLITFVFHYLEELIPLVRKTGGLAAAHHVMLKEISWPHVGAVQLWIFFCVLLYCIGVELIRAIGSERAMVLLFGERKAPPRP